MQTATDYSSSNSTVAADLELKALINREKLQFVVRFGTVDLIVDFGQLSQSWPSCQHRQPCGTMIVLEVLLIIVWMLQSMCQASQDPHYCTGCRDCPSTHSSHLQRALTAADSTRMSVEATLIRLHRRILG